MRGIVKALGPAVEVQTAGVNASAGLSVTGSNLDEIRENALIAMRKAYPDKQVSVAFEAVEARGTVKLVAHVRDVPGALKRKSWSKQQ